MTALGAFYTLLLPSDTRELPFMLFEQLHASLAASSTRMRVQDRSHVVTRKRHARRSGSLRAVRTTAEN